MDLSTRSTSLNYLNDFRIFLAEGGDPNHQDKFQDTMLHLSTKAPNGFEIVEELVKAGADVNLANFLGRTPLHNAVINRNRSAVRALIHFGASINAQDCCGNSVLHYAINTCASRNQDWKCDKPVCSHRAPDMDIIEKLLQHEGIVVNVRNLKGCTPLLWAVKAKSLDIVKALLAKSANVNISNRHFETPLHAALYYPQPNMAIVGELLRCGAGIYCYDSNSQIPRVPVLKRIRDADSEELVAKFVKLE